MKKNELEIDKTMIPLVRWAKRASKELVYLTHNQKTVGALVPATDEDREAHSLACNPDFLAFIEERRRRHEAEGGLSEEEARKRLGLKPRVKRESTIRRKRSLTAHRAIPGKSPR